VKLEKEDNGDEAFQWAAAIYIGFLL